MPGRTRVLAAWSCSLMLAGCASGGGPDESSATYLPQTYVVRADDTLYTIAWRHNLDYREVARWNNIGADYKVAIGQVLILHPARLAAAAGAPVSEVSRNAASPRLRSPTESSDSEGPRGDALSDTPRIAPASTPGAAAIPQTPVSMPSAAATSSPAVTPIAAPPAEARPRDAAPSKAVPAARGKWVWPTDRASAPRPVPGGGILLLGKLGQDIRAAGSGRVVYTGSGLRGYGNLIIIKHGDSLLSSYAHNRELLVHEGEEVAMGQVIARMGTGPHRVCALYFEIRVNGKPADPLQYLASAR